MNSISVSRICKIYCDQCNEKGENGIKITRHSPLSIDYILYLCSDCANDLAQTIQLERSKL